jgi:Domain of unknown function (DUF1707)/Domain of unknown function (DUF4190)
MTMGYDMGPDGYGRTRGYGQAQGYGQVQVPYGGAQAPPPLVRATDRDRDAAIAVVQTAYTSGRLTRDEHDDRVGRLLAAQTYAELDGLTADLPGRPWYPDVPAIPRPPHTNGLAVAALICALLQPFTGMLTTIPAIVLGHVARGQIRHTGDEGNGMATWGMALGWAGASSVIVFVLFVAALIVHVTH